MRASGSRRAGARARRGAERDRCAKEGARSRCRGGRAAEPTSTAGLRTASEKAEDQCSLHFRRPRMWFGATHRAVCRCVRVLPALCRTSRAERPAWRAGVNATEAWRFRSFSVAASVDQRRRRSLGTSHSAERSSSRARAEAARRATAADRDGSLPQLRGLWSPAGSDPPQEAKRVRSAEARSGMPRGRGESDALRRGPALQRRDVGFRPRKDCCRPGCRSNDTNARV